MIGVTVLQYPVVFHALTLLIRNVMATYCIRYDSRVERRAILIAERGGNFAVARRLDGKTSGKPSLNVRPVERALWTS